MADVLVEWSRVLALANGCHDYSGGHHGEAERAAFHHGIDTVINVLKAAANGADDMQIRTIEAIGREAVSRAASEMKEGWEFPPKAASCTTCGGLGWVQDISTLYSAGPARSLRCPACWKSRGEPTP